MDRQMTTRTNTIAEVWENYSKQIPEAYARVPRQEMQRLFYAGAAAIMGIQADLSRQELSEAAFMAIMEGLDEELAAFVNTAELIDHVEEG